MKHVENWRMQIRERTAATTIQKHFRKLRARLNFIKRIHQRYIAQMTPIAICIQKVWKMYTTMKTNKNNFFIEKIVDECESKTEKISNKIKRKTK